MNLAQCSLNKLTHKFYKDSNVDNKNFTNVTNTGKIFGFLNVLNYKENIDFPAILNDESNAMA